MNEKEYKEITSELCYLRKTIEQLIEKKPVEYHVHYTIDYSALVKILEEKGYL